MAASASAYERSIARARRVAFIAAAFLLVGCPARNDPPTLEAHVKALEETVQQAPPDTSQDDKLFTPLSQVLRQAGDIVLGETGAVSEDGKQVTFLIQRTAKGALQESRKLTIPHPRLATSKGFVAFDAQSRFVYVLIVDATGEWRTPEFGEESVFRVENGRVLIPQFYRPGAALPAEGPAAAVSLEAFFSVAHTCHAQDETKCAEAIGNLFTAQ